MLVTLGATRSFLTEVTESLIIMEGRVNFWSLSNVVHVIFVYKGQLGRFPSQTRGLSSLERAEYKPSF